MSVSALRIAWRDLRSSWTRFAFVVLAVAAGVGALTGVRGFAESFRSMLLSEARTLMAADIAVRLFANPTPAQEQMVASLVSRGAVVTRTAETLTMVSAEPSGDPVLVTLKAVDPELYPLYGKVTLEPAVPLRDALGADSVVVSPDLGMRLGVGRGW